MDMESNPSYETGQLVPLSVDSGTEQFERCNL